MNIQEREQIEYEMGCQSEQMNALHVSVRSLGAANSKEKEKIDLFLSEGQFVLILEGTAYCPMTDASIGTKLVFVAAYQTREIAEKALRYKQDWNDEECRYSILPKEPKNVSALQFNENQNLPF